jgi:ribonuclease T2
MSLLARVTWGAAWTAAAAGLVLSASGFGAVRASPPLPTPAPHDFYVLALSWSPTHCAERTAARRDPMQCDGRRPYAFVVHGLWPQWEKGYPRFCGTRHRPPGRETTLAMQGIMPSTRLVAIQWERHGGCSNLSADAYFAKTREAFARISVPARFQRPDDWQSLTAGEVERAFVAANPGLKRDGIAVKREGNLLDEVRICLTHDLAFRACAEVDARGAARGERLSVPPARAGGFSGRN